MAGRTAPAGGPLGELRLRRFAPLRLGRNRTKPRAEGDLITLPTGLATDDELGHALTGLFDDQTRLEGGRSLSS